MPNNPSNYPKKLMWNYKNTKCKAYMYFNFTWIIWKKKKLFSNNLILFNNLLMINRPVEK